MDIAYGMHRAVPDLSEVLGLSTNVLDSLLKIRTDLDHFSDTEIFVLAYAGYRLAEFGFHYHHLLAGDHRPAAETLLEFRAITEGILHPLPVEEWENHLAHSVSRIALRREAGRKLSPLISPVIAKFKRAIASLRPATRSA